VIDIVQVKNKTQNSFILPEKMMVFLIVF